MAEVFVEQVDWRRQNIKDTTLRIVGFYTNDLAHMGTSRWVDFATKAISVIMGEENPRDVELKGEAFRLTLQPPKPMLIPVWREGEEIWEEREPRLVFLDSTLMVLNPSYRNLIYRVNDAIAEEAASTYKVQVLKNPLSFVFPKSEYGRVNIGKAVLLESFRNN